MRARHRVQVLVAALAVLLAVPTLPAPLARAAPSASVTLTSPGGEGTAAVLYGDPFTIVATVDPEGAAGPDAVVDGSVTFTGIGDPVTVPVTAGIAEHTWTLPTASTGIQATYHDGSEYVAPPSGVFSLAVLPVPVTVVCTTQPTSPEFGGFISLDVTVDPSEPTASGWTRSDALFGGVRVFLVPPSGPEVQVGEQPISGGETSVPLAMPSGAPFAGGTHAVRVEYTGGMVPGGSSFGFAPGSATGAFTVAEAPATVSIAGPAAVTYGSAQPYAISVGPWATAHPPLGLVRLFDGSPATGAELGAWLLGPSDTGLAPISLPRSLAAGTHHLVATFDGNTPSAADPNRLDGTSDALDVTVAAAELTPVVTVESKTYDGTRDATIASRAVSGAIAEGDLVHLEGGTAAFSDASAGAAKAVSVTGLTLGGPDAANYHLATTTATATADVAPRAITVTADDRAKAHGDGDPPLTYAITGGSLVGSDALSGALAREPGEGTGTYVIGRGTLAATSNYTLTFVPGTFTIAGSILTVTADAKTRAYGSPNPPLTFTYTGLVGGDTPASITTPPTCTTTATTGSPVGGYAITCAGAADPDYAFSYQAGTLVVGKRTLTVAATGAGKVYDGTTAATVTLADDRLAGDSLALTYASAAFDGPNAGDGRPVTVSGIAIAGGAAAGNYTLASTLASTTASIAAAPTSVSVSSTTNPAPVSATVTVTARAAWSGGIPTGSVVFRDGSTAIGGAVALVNGSASVPVAWSASGTHEITAVYVPDSTNLAATTSPVHAQVVRRSSVTVELTADPGTWETDVPITITARLAPATAGVTVAPTGDVAFRIDGVPVARVPVVAAAASYRAQLATAGGHTIVAAFVPDTASAIAFDGGESAPLTGTVVANTVNASGVGLSGTSIYPYRDAWRDTVTIQGYRVEPLSVSIRIYRPTGSLLATRAIAVGTGAYASTWNGRSASGTILPAGRYRVVQTLSDPSSVPSLVQSWTAYVTLSAKRMAWTTVSLERDANAPARWSGSPSRLSSTRYGSGVRLATSASTPGWAALGYSFTLPSATAIRSVAFSVQGGPWSGPTPPKIGLHDWRTGADWTAMYDGTRTRKAVGTSTTSWYSIAGDPAIVVRTVSGRRYVRAYVDTGGHVAGFRYELGKVRLTVTYGVLR